VRADQYEEALDALEQIKGQFIKEFANNQQEREIWEKEWPFSASGLTGYARASRCADIIN
jgi:hypothetical protein